jgi:hypothetical protein
MSDPADCISESTRRILRELSEQMGRPVQAILDRAVEDYRRKLFFEGLTADYAALKADPAAWADELAERRLWESTLTDGQDDAEPTDK